MHHQGHDAEIVDTLRMGDRPELAGAAGVLVIEHVVPPQKVGLRRREVTVGDDRIEAAAETVWGRQVNPRPGEHRDFAIGQAGIVPGSDRPPVHQDADALAQVAEFGGLFVLGPHQRSGAAVVMVEEDLVGARIVGRH